MKRILLFAALAASVAPASIAQTVPVTASNMQDGSVALTGKIEWAPVLSSGVATYYHKPGGGLATVTPITVPVIAGGFSVPAIADSALTIPVNLCWRVTVYRANGSAGASIPCVQPSASNTWWNGTSDNFDNWLPSITALPMFSGGVTINGFAGAWTLGSGFTCNASTLTCTTNGGGGGGSMTWPGGSAGIPNYNGSSAWGISYNASNQIPANFLNLTAYTPTASLGSAAFDAASAFDASGAASTAQAASLQKASNLSDVASASTARTNLGLGSAATQASSAFDAAGAASTAQAASLQKTNNLSDLALASTARINLGLGSAATQASSAFDAAGAAAAAQAAAIAASDTAGAAATAQAASLQKTSNLSDLGSASTARTNLGLGSAATQASSAFDAAGAASTVQALIPAASSTTPLVNGTAAVGAGTTWARADHVHPSDTTRVPTTTTVNGHALSANVVVTASDLTTGTLAIADGGTGSASAGAALTALGAAASNASTTVNGQTCTLGSTCTIALSAVNAQAVTYQVLAADFSNYKTITVASGTFTVTLVASGTQPANGQYVRVLNYGSGVVTVAASGQNINGVATSQTLAAGSASAPTGIVVQSDGTNYFAQPFGASSGGGGSPCTGTANAVQYNNSGAFGCAHITDSGTALTATEPEINSATQAASTPVYYSTGALFGGTGTTTFPLFFHQPTGATAITTFATGGTIYGSNEASGFSGNFIDFRTNGASEFALSAFGGITAAGSISSNHTGSTFLGISSTDYITPVVTLSGTTPAITASNGLQTITLSGNTTPTLTGLATGQRITFEICQPASGGPFTWTWPSAFHGGVTIGTSASTCSMQSFNSFNGTTLVPESSGVTGIAP